MDNSEQNASTKDANQTVKAGNKDGSIRSKVKKKKKKCSGAGNAGIKGKGQEKNAEQMNHRSVVAYASSIASKPSMEDQLRSSTVAEAVQSAKVNVGYKSPVTPKLPSFRKEGCQQREGSGKSPVIPQKGGNHIPALSLAIASSKETTGGVNMKLADSQTKSLGKKKKKRKRVDTSSESDALQNAISTSGSTDIKTNPGAADSTSTKSVVGSCEEKKESEHLVWDGPNIINGSTLNVAVASLNSHLSCTLCKGYYRDPHTIPECLHTFCKSCICTVFYHGFRKCPTCQISLEPDPVQHLLSDRTVQELVEKLLPLVVERDTAAEEEFYSKWNLQNPNESRQSGDGNFIGGNEKRKQSKDQLLHGSASQLPVVQSESPAKMLQKNQGGNTTALKSSTVLSETQKSALLKRAVPPDELEFLLKPDSSPDTNTSQQMPPLQNPLLRVSGKLKIIQLRKYIIKKLNVISPSLGPRAVEILCYGDPLGDELSLTFIHRTRWAMAPSQPDATMEDIGIDTNMTLTYRLNDESTF